MALITKNIYFISLNTDKVPLGHSVASSEASLGTEELTERVEFNITASDAVASTDIAGFNDLINVELLAEIDTYIAANTGFGIDLSANDVSYNANILSIKYGDNFTDVYLTSALVQFKIIVDIKIYIDSQGAFNEPAVRAFTTSTTEISFNFDDVLADSYDYEVSDDSLFSNVVSSANVADNTEVNITGLDAATTYYIRVKANKSGFNTSAWASTNTKTLPYIPLEFWNFQGIGYDGTNAFGKTGDVTATKVDEVYAALGASANTLTPVSVQAAIKVQNNNNEVNGITPNTHINNGAYQALATPRVLSGDFTVIMDASNNNLSTVHFFLMSNLAKTTRVRVSTINAQFIDDAGGSKQINWSSTPAPVAYNRNVFVWKQLSGVLYWSNDGGATYDSIAATGNSFTVEQLFGSGVVWYATVVGIFSQDLTQAEIAQYINIDKQIDRVVPSETLIPKGLTFEALTGDYYVNNLLEPQATASLNHQRLWVRGDYAYMTVTKDDLNNDDRTELLLVYQFSTGKISVGPTTVYPPERIINDPHDVASLFLLEDKLVTAIVSDHYDNTVTTGMLFYETPSSLNLISQNQIGTGNGFASFKGGYTQYLQYVKTANYDIIIAQEWYPGQGARWITMYRSKDGFNSFEDKHRVVSTNNTTWLYPRSIYSEDGVMWLVLNHITLNDRYTGSYLIKSVDEGLTWTSPDGVSLSVSIDGVVPVAIADIIAQADATIIDGTAKTFSTTTWSIFKDPTDDEIYASCSNGDDDGINLVRYRSGTWSSVAVDLLAKNIIVAAYTDNVAFPSHGHNVPTFIRRGAQEYDLYCEEVVTLSLPTAIFKIVKFKTIDDGTTWTYEGAITADDTLQHYRLNTPVNLHYAGGSTAYDENILLIASRDDNNIEASATYSDVFIKDIS